MKEISIFSPPHIQKGGEGAATPPTPSKLDGFFVTHFLDAVHHLLAIHCVILYIFSGNRNNISVYMCPYKSRNDRLKHTTKLFSLQLMRNNIFLARLVSFP